MKRDYRKLLSLVIVIQLMLSLLSGCGTVKKAEPAEAAAENTLVNKTGLPIVNTPTTFKIMLRKEPTDKTTWAEKECIKKAMEETGLKFEFIEAQAQGWEEKVSVTLATSDLPDVIIGDIKNLSIYLGSFIPLNKMLDTYAPKTVSLLNLYPQVKGSITQADGKIYSLPLVNLVGFTSNLTMSINKSWMDKLSLKMPETNDELYDVLKAFKEKDPNGNGKQDEIPYGFCMDPASPGYGLNAMMWNFGINNDGINETSQHFVMVENGKVVFIGRDNRFYEFLKYMNKLSKDGMIDPDSFLQKNPDLLAKGQKGLYGLITHSSYDDLIVGADNSNNYVPLLPMKDKDGKRMSVLYKVPGLITPGQFKITTACKNPEAMVRLYDYVNSSFESKMLWSFGPENVSYIKQDNGKFTRQTKMPQGFNTFADLRQTMSTGVAGFWFWTNEDQSRFDTTPREQKLTNRGNLLAPYAKKELIPYGQDSAEACNNRATMFIEIDTYMQNFIAESILKGIDDTKWNAHLDKLKKLNIDQFVKDYQIYYDRSMAILNSK